MRGGTNARTKQNGFDFGVSIGGGAINSNHNNPPPLASTAVTRRSFNNNGINQPGQQQQQQRSQPDLTSAIEAALRNGNFLIANRALVALPWLKMFPKTDEEIEQELKDEEERRRQRMMVGDGKPHPNNTIARFGRRRMNHGVDFDMTNTANQLKWWEGHPIVQIDCSSNNIDCLVSDFEDLSLKHLDRFSRLAENLKILQASRNSMHSLPSFQGFGILAFLDISRNQLSGDLMVLLAVGNVACNNNNNDDENDDGDANNNTNNNSRSRNNRQPQHHHFPNPPLLPALVELNASHNSLSAANGVLEYLAPDLRVLRLNNNKLERFSLLMNNNNNSNNNHSEDNGMRVKISSLREVDLSNNKLSYAPFAVVSAFQQQHHDILFCSHPCLEMLDLSFNSGFANSTPDIMIGKIPNETSSLPPGFSQHMSKLRSLNLRHCGLSSLTLSLCPELRDLNVSENNLLSFPFVDLATRAQLSSVDISGNKLTTLDALVLVPTTGDAAIGANSVAALFPNLERLDVTNNDLNSIPPRICLFPKLRNMTLNGNPIRTIRRDLLAKNTLELKAYLRSRLDERENDESSLANSKTLQVSEAMMEKTQQYQHHQQDGNYDMNNNNNNNMNQFQQQPPPPPPHRQVAAQQSIARNNNNSNNQQFIQPIGLRIGNLWDLSKKPSNSSSIAPTARNARGSFVNQNHAAVAATASSDNIPLLPSTLIAACILDVAPHTKDHVSQCTKLSLSGQSRLREISTDFFGALVPQLTELDVSRTDLASLKEILGDMNNGAPMQLRVLNASRCSLQGPWPVEWCRPLPGDQQMLAHLDISCNGITSLPEQFGLAVCWSLRHLNISNNKITHLPQGLLHLRQLTELLYSSNGLVDSSFQPFGDLSQYWPNLSTLDLSFNELRSVHFLPNALGGFAPHVMRALKLEGNGIRFLSASILEGTGNGILAALKDRMSAK